MALANRLVGNPPETPVLELALCAATLQGAQPLRLAWVGAPWEVTLDGQSVAMGAFSVREGQSLRVRPGRRGARIALAARGGWSLPAIGSGAGRLQKGMTLRAAKGVWEAPVPLPGWPTSLRAGPLRVVPYGEEARWEEAFGAEPFCVGSQMSRVGIRLEGRILPPGEEGASEPSCVGLVQVANDGQPILVGPDGPTIGGYPKLGVVCAADRNRMGQLRPGDWVRFERIVREEAWAFSQEEARLRLTQARWVRARHGLSGTEVLTWGEEEER